jgi:fructokinase
MGALMRIDLRLEKARGSAMALGSGFIALDVIEGAAGDRCAAGGTCGNVLAILAWLGWRSAPVARLGKDNAGQFVRKEFGQAGVDTRLVRQHGGTPTPVVVQRMVVDAKGRRSHRFALTCPECGQWLPRFRPILRADAEHAKAFGFTPSVFFFDRVSPGIVALARWARQAGALVMFEPSNYSDDKNFRAAIELAHVLKYSKERLGHVRDFGSTPYPAVLIETLGEEGLRIRWKDHWSAFDAFSVPRFVDAAGAGDWTTAGFLHVVGQGGSAGLKSCGKGLIERGLRTGQALSALNCGYEGARGLMDVGDREKVSRLLRAMAGGKGSLPDEHEVAAKKRKPVSVSVCDLCAPGKERRVGARKAG